MPRFNTFREASKYAKALAQKIGETVSLNKIDGEWEVLDPSDHINHEHDSIQQVKKQYNYYEQKTTYYEPEPEDFPSSKPSDWRPIGRKKCFYCNGYGQGNGRTCSHCRGTGYE